MKRRLFYVPSPSLQGRTTCFEAELTEMLMNSAVRQLCIFQTPEGWMLKVLPTWKHEFYTLVAHNRRKEIRYYQSLDRLIRSVTKFGPLPPTLLFGENQ